jgi:hypothetical protein
MECRLSEGGGGTIWPFSHIGAVPAIVKLRRIHLDFLCGAFRDARHCFI